MTDITIADNPQARRFELKKAGVVAVQTEYELGGGAVKFIHTEVQPGYEGQGLGSKLAKFALDDVRRRGLKVVPVCEFIAGYIRKHAEYLELVTDENRQAFKL
jgi:predicted GNAT family acetyltransferase